MKRLAQLALVLAAAALTALGQFSITTTSLPPAIIGQPYPAVVLKTANDPGPVLWDFLPAGSGPPGFVIGPASPGQPSSTGTFCYGFGTQGPPVCNGAVSSGSTSYSFSVQATSVTTGKTAFTEFSLPVVQPLQITTAGLPNAAANQPYNAQMNASGGTGQFSWSVPAGTLPPGIVMSPAGTFSGTAPSANGSFTFAVQVTDQITNLTAASQFTISIGGGVAIVTTALPNATVNQLYSFQLVSSGAPNPIWTLQQGSLLPIGFTLPAGGLLTGLSSATGKFTFTVQLADTQVAGIDTRTFDFFVTLGPLSIAEPTLPNANQNLPYQATLTPVGGLPPYTWSFDVASPQGLSIDINTGVITGTPKTPGGFPIPVSLHDATGAVFSQTYTLTVFPAVSITTTSLANASPGTPYLDRLAATGGSLPYTWTVSAGNLPPGLGITAANGQISGTPTAAGTFPFTVQVKDFLGGTATKALSITVGAGLVITTTSLPGGALNQPYSQTLASTGGLLPLTWSIASGALPPPLTLDGTTGVISGTPASTGNFAFVVLATDARGAVARASLSINIANPVIITTGDLSGNVLAAFSQTLAATGGTPPYTWAVTSGTLPGGLQLDGITGVISGNPSPGGTSQVTFTATDARGLTGSKSIAITIIAPPPPAVSISVGTTTQPAVSLSTGASYPLEITGFLTLTFTSSVGSPDGLEARFSDGTRKLFFVVRPNTTQGLFTTVSNGTPAILPGTVAGVITLTVSMNAGGQDITPSPAPTSTITAVAVVPVINTVTLQQVTGGVSVVVTGYSNTREVSSGSFTFTVSGSTLSPITVPLTSAFTTWFSNSTSNATGGQFRLTVPFSVTGSATSISRVSVTLTNSKGASAAASSP
jgi:hypothetical protein